MQLQLDKSRPFSQCLGERTDGDTHGEVWFFQDNLPFGSSGVLVPETKKNTPGPDGITLPIVMDNGSIRHVHHPPLWTEERRVILKKKTAKLERQQRSSPGDSGPVDLADWLRGKVYAPDPVIFAVARQMMSKVYTRRRDVVEDLLYEKELMPDSEVDPELLKLLDE